MEESQSKPGDDFVLFSSPDEDWFEQAQQVQATDVVRRGALPMEVIWEQKGFLGRQSERQTTIIGTHILANGKEFVLLPSDVLVLPEKGIPDSLFVGVSNSVDSRVNLAQPNEQPITKNRTD